MVGCCDFWKCFVACLFGESSQQPTCRTTCKAADGPIRHRRRGTPCSRSRSGAPVCGPDLPASPDAGTARPWLLLTGLPDRARGRWRALLVVSTLPDRFDPVIRCGASRPTPEAEDAGGGAEDVERGIHPLCIHSRGALGCAHGRSRPL